MTDNFCKCSDPGCPVCNGFCLEEAVTRLFRIDMDDLTGTPMCEGCADDAMACGVFTESPADNDNE